MSGIILFDGVCNLCNQAVDFVIKQDKKGYYQFASLQSESGQRLKKEYGIPDHIDSMIVIENNRAFSKSDAAIKIVPKLSFYWQPARLAILIPRPIRNRLYEWIAKNRLRWFGEKETCRLPSPSERERFLP
ncbi:putative DCC family thiol-disulfide oxidoreductase YuxK [Alkalihalobacillus xiaoxiensis]|uniref:DCC family thiol-disulfide oxidoreductase YuxK n=1 Tax=Shouchella xiaoxiensis TaxID=766895 RepID=A0ABS2SQD4_9BACI|nr:thiol-disulfide oxidoreductase DCC family protein [Shouchella xiaoxiensis]MBM7837455.1 putative DCC family thiol-disulfide oxidoreductase YuxK [Shouchella xiaoxiensis]